MTDRCVRDVTWVLTTGEAGMRSQALGLAEAVGLPIEEKRIVVRAPWSWLPGGLLPMPLSALDPSGDRLDAALAAPRRRLRTPLDRRGAGGEAALRRPHLGGLCAEPRMGAPAVSTSSPPCRMTA